MNYQEIKFDIDERNVAWITLNKEAKHNAMGTLMMQEIRDACGNIENNDSIRAVVLTGAGEKSFSAGADLEWMKANFKKNREERIAASGLLAETLESLNTLNKVTIARVNGQAYAGGVGLISVCDIVIAVNTAKFSLTETRIGITPANISPFLIEKLGVSNARRTLINAHFFSAEEGVQFGLIHKAVERDELDSQIETEIQSCLACAPGAIEMTKNLIRTVSNQTPQENKTYTAQLLADAWETPEAEAGIGSFFEKKPPPWTN